MQYIIHASSTIKRVKINAYKTGKPLGRPNGILGKYFLRTGSKWVAPRLCPTADFGDSDLEPSGSATAVSVTFTNSSQIV